MKNKIISIICILIAFFVGCGIMYFVIGKYPALFSTVVTKEEKTVTINDTGIADSVEKVYDSVVIVSSYKDNKLSSSGTGFVYKTTDDVAYILTNNHVIEKGTKVTVTFTNGEVKETTIVGKNTLSDIAVLSLNKKDILSVAKIGKNDSVRVGDTTFAVGAPIDNAYSWTVTRGIISGKDRMVEVNLSSNKIEYVMKVMQTDAAINEGNSGGPLCNANGEVIGITSLKLVDESVEGMGFAIPIEVATKYADKLIAGETITQPYFGITMLNVHDGYYYPQYYKKLTEYNITKGVIILTIESNSPVDKAGLKSGDIITKIDNNEITSIGYLRYYLYSYNAGDKVTITYNRDGKTYDASVTLEASKTIY